MVSVGFEAVGVGLAATKGMSARSAVARTVNCMEMLWLMSDWWSCESRDREDTERDQERG